jgi:hypothetical protein
VGGGGDVITQALPKEEGFFFKAALGNKGVSIEADAIGVVHVDDTETQPFVEDGARANVFADRFDQTLKRGVGPAPRKPLRLAGPVEKMGVSSPASHELGAERGRRRPGAAVASLLAKAPNLFAVDSGQQAHSGCGLGLPLDLELAIRHLDIGLAEHAGEGGPRDLVVEEEPDQRTRETL